MSVPCNCNQIHLQIVHYMPGGQPDNQLHQIWCSTRQVLFLKTLWNRQINRFPTFPPFSPARSTVPRHVRKPCSGCTQRHNKWCITGGPSGSSRWLSSLHWHSSASLSFSLACSIHLSVHPPSALLRLFPLNLWSFSTFKSALRLWYIKKRGAWIHVMQRFPVEKKEKYKK